nr:hypothetical protein [Tanacetum cinerariifolium]
MVLTFADTHNMIAYLTKSDASEGFDQIIDFLNASVIKYALTINPNICISCIKQFWSSVSFKKGNDVMRLKALIDRKKVIITEATVLEALHLDDAESIDCLPNEEIFTELARMGYEKPSMKLTFYKNKFSSSMALAVICLSRGRKFNTSKYIFDSLVRNVDSSSKFYMKVEALEKDKVAQALEIIKLKQRVKKLERKNKVKVSGLRRLKKVGTAQRVKSSADTVKDDASKQGGIIADIDAYEDVTLKDVAVVAHEVKVEKEVKFKENADVQGRQVETQAQTYKTYLEHADKVLSMQDDEPEPAKLKEVVEVVTIDKLMTEVVTPAMATIIAIATVVPTITTAPSAARRRKGVVIRYPKETDTPATIIHFEPKFKDKGKGIMVQEPKPLKKQAHIKQDEAYARELEAELNKNINWDDV